MTFSLKESQEEIKRQEERRRQFMADASHEMRTPLTTINGLLEGLEYNAIPENQKENAIRLMKNETERLIRLVNENLDYEKIRTNQISIVVKKFNATDALKTILSQLESKAEPANDQLILETTQEIDIFADYDRFVQIMVNIIQNAIQFTKDGEIRVKIEKGYLETIIEISDTGIGMTEEQLKNIWDRYYKVDPSRKNRKFGESGLGLPIVQQLVRLHKGKIDVKSELNQGTTFRISFPDTEIKD
jgi:signal transduction histidine kinase